MNILTKIFKKNSGHPAAPVSIHTLARVKYRPKYKLQCRFIREHYIPEAGQSRVLQGELLRELDKLRYEAVNNGNINWDDDYSYFCDFIRDTLCRQPIFDSSAKEAISCILSYLKSCGEYADQWHSGEIPDDKLIIEQLAYTGDNLYDMAADAIGYFQKQNPTPIPHRKDLCIKR